MKQGILIVLLLSGKLLFCQELFTEYQVWPVGGKAQFDQVVETQLNLPEVLLTKHFAANVKVNFVIDSQGVAREFVIDGTNNQILRKEVERIMNFFRFHQGTLMMAKLQPYFVVFNLSTKEYNKFLKQRSRAKVQLPGFFDTTMSIVSRADRSPVYYKNGDEGFKEYILSEISYPDAALQKSIEGTVLLEYTVETNGFVTDIEVKQPVPAGCSEEAVRLIKTTRWQPALLHGKAVRYRMRYPITFSLRTSGNTGFQPATTVGN